MTPGSLSLGQGAARSGETSPYSILAEGLTVCGRHMMLPCKQQEPIPSSDQARAAIDECGLSRRGLCAEIELDEASMPKFMSRQRGLSRELLDRLGLTLCPVKPAKRAKEA